MNPNNHNNPGNWVDEEPFFNFDVPFGAMIVFENGDEKSAEYSMLDDFSKNNLIPCARITDENHPYIQELESQKGPEFKDRKIRSVIIPIRYSKVFRS